MLKRRVQLALVGLALVVGVAVTGLANGDEDEEKVSIDQVPAAVKATILKEAGGATIKEIERETKNGKTAYEAEWVADGKEIEIKVAPDGALLKREVEEEDDDDGDEEKIPLDQVPVKAREALLKHARGATITEVEREKERGVVLYEAQWKADGREHEAKVTASGELVELEEEVDPNQVPAAVKATAAEKFPAGAKLEYEKKMIVLYEIEAKIDGKEREVLISPTGKVLGKKHSHHDNDDGDDDEDDDEDHDEDHDEDEDHD